MSLVAKLIMSLTSSMTVGAFEQQCQHPRAAQEKLLRHILEKNKNTKFGKKYGFARIKTLRAFQKRVPVCTYEDLKPYIDAQLRGQAVNFPGHAKINGLSLVFGAIAARVRALVARITGSQP